MIPSFSSWKVVTFFGKEHINWSSNYGVMMGRSWKIEIKNVTKKIMDLIVQLLPIITPLILDQLTSSLPKNVTTFHGQQDGIIHFSLSPNKRGVLALWIYIFTKKIMNFSKLNFSTSFKLPKKNLLLGRRQKWMIPSCSHWKVVTFCGRNHVDWSSINGVTTWRI